MISLSIEGEETNTDAARRSRRRISGTENGFDLSRMTLTASAIWDLKARSSSSDECAGESFCRFVNPGHQLSFTIGLTLTQYQTGSAKFAIEVVLGSELASDEVGAVRWPATNFGHDG